MNTPPHERRGALRYNMTMVRVTGTIREVREPDSDTATTHRFVLITLSEIGCCVSIPDAPPDTFARTERLRIELPGPPAAEATARIVHRRADERRHGVALGLKFETIDEASDRSIETLIRKSLGYVEPPSSVTVRQAHLHDKAILAFVLACAVVLGTILVAALREAPRAAEAVRTRAASHTRNLVREATDEATERMRRDMRAEMARLRSMLIEAGSPTADRDVGTRAEPRTHAPPSHYGGEGATPR